MRSGILWPAALGLGVASVAAGAGGAPATQGARLNVVWLIGDDHTCSATGCYGSVQASTPNLDRLAAGGMRFDRAYCNSPMCTPSRQSFLCGRYPRATGVMCLKDALSEGEWTLAEHLRGLGYRTGAFGKMHFNSDLRHGFEVAVTERGRWAAYEREHPPMPIPEGIRTLPVWRPFKDPARIWLNGMYLPYARTEEQMESTFYAAQAIAFMREHRSEPFFVVVGFREPHSPFWFPIEYRGRYDPATLPVPEPGPEDAAQIPLIFRDLSQADKQGIIASAYTSTAVLDASVGRVVEAIRAMGLSERTLIVYLSDNGYHLGQHGRFEKHSFFEDAVRCPMIWSLPGVIPRGVLTRSLVEFVDLVPTVLDVAGLPRPAGVVLQGRSLQELFSDPGREVREAVFSEYAHSEEAMVRTPRWKLIYEAGKRERDDGYATGGPLPGRRVRLYDEQNDPQEMRNLAGLREHGERVQCLVQRLRDHLVSTERDPSAVPRLATAEETIDWCLTRLAERRRANSGGAD